MGTRGEQSPLPEIEGAVADAGLIRPAEISSQQVNEEVGKQISSSDSNVVHVSSQTIRLSCLSTFLSALVLFIVFQLCLDRFSAQLQTLESMSYAFVREIVKSDTCVSSKILCFGDSLVKMGVSPAILESFLKEPVCNLAVPGSRPSASYFILRRALKTGASPKAVLVDFESGILRDDPCKAVHESAEFFGLDDCLDLAAVTRDFDYVSSLMAAVTVPSYRLKYPTCAALRRAFRLDGGIDKKEILEYVSNWRNNRGQTLPPYSSPLQIEGNNKIVWKDIIEKRVPWYCHPMNRVYLEQFIGLANKHGITVYWLLPPMHPAAQLELEKTGVDSAYCQFAASMLKRFPNLRIVDGRHAHYGSENFMGGCHLNRLGSMVYSAGLGELLTSQTPEIRRELSQRWLALPVYRRPEASVTAD